MASPELVEQLYQALPDETKEFLTTAIEKVVEVKKRGGKVAAVIGSGPNLHEGVTPLLLHLFTPVLSTALQQARQLSPTKWAVRSTV